MKWSNRNQCNTFNIYLFDLYTVFGFQLSATVRLPSGSDYSLELDLAHSVVPTQTVFKALISKVSDSFSPFSHSCNV